MLEIKGKYLPALQQQKPIYSYKYDSQSLFTLFKVLRQLCHINPSYFHQDFLMGVVLLSV